MKKADKQHFAKVFELGCVACMTMGIETPHVEIHHIGNGATGKKATNREVIGLCVLHHRSGNIGVAVHAGRKSWEANFGTERQLLNQVMDMLNE